MRHGQFFEPNPSNVTYIPMESGFMRLVAIMDWYSCYILLWRLYNTPVVEHATQ